MAAWRSSLDGLLGTNEVLLSVDLRLYYQGPEADEIQEADETIAWVSLGTHQLTATFTPAKPGIYTLRAVIQNFAPEALVETNLANNQR